MKTHAPGRFLRALPFALALVSTSVAAQEPPEDTRQPVRRSLYLPTNPGEGGPEVFVAPLTATLLRFDVPCDPRKTKLQGWEGRFEPLLVGGRSVVIVPLHPLSPDDRFHLQVELMDGTSLPFTVLAAQNRADGQVDVFPVPRPPVATRSLQEENRVLRAENQRYRQEEGSVDHALATLLATHQLEHTPFRVAEKWLVYEPGVEVEVSILIPRKEARTDTRLAIIFQVKNHDPARPWHFQEARLMSLATRQPRSFALRMAPSSIAPGASGQIAVITDLASFDSKNPEERGILEIFRDGGLRQGYIELKVATLLARYRR